MAFAGPQIICTLGPVSGNPAALLEMARAGMTALRVNCSHYEQGPTERLVRLLREAHPAVGIVFDLQGPKIRVAAGFREQPVRTGQVVQFVDGAAPVPRVGAASLVIPLALGVPFAALAGAETVYMKDGTMAFDVREGSAECGYLLAVTRVGGVARGEKAVNVPGALDGVSALTEQDRADVRFALAVGADAVMASFVNRAADVLDLRTATEAAKAGKRPQVWAKVETRAAVKNLSGVCRAADAVMIGRGDLGVEVGPIAAPAAQSQILRKARREKKPCYVATQVLESMRNSPTPTRSELRDVYLSLEEGARGFMLTAETSVGKHPVAAIRVLAEMLEAYSKG